MKKINESPADIREANRGADLYEKELDRRAEDAPAQQPHEQVVYSGDWDG